MLNRSVFRTPYTMRLFRKIINCFQPLTVFAKSFYLDVWKSSKYTSATTNLWFSKIFHEILSWVVSVSTSLCRNIFRRKLTKIILFFMFSFVIDWNQTHNYVKFKQMLKLILWFWVLLSLIGHFKAKKQTHQMSLCHV